MQPKYEDSKFKKWLDKLQQESWQLELVISGVAIFGLINSFEPVLIFAETVKNKVIDQPFLSTILGTVMASIMMSLLALTFFLILHIVLRGLWIGAIGLRYFSGDIDYDSLKYTEKFTAYLQRKIGSFDRYIAGLEDVCSIIFAVSFLLVFFFISFFFSLIIAAIPFYLLIEYLGEYFHRILKILLFVLVSLAYLITFLDFFTQGFFKRKKWLAVVYFPIYRIMSRVTLSFIYRPLLYNLLDNKIGKRVLLIIVPLFLAMLWTTGFEITESNFHLDGWKWKKEIANSENYYDLLEEETAFVKDIAIPSRTIKTSYLTVFLKHRGQFEDAIFLKDSTLKPENDIRGLSMNAFKTAEYNSDSLQYKKLKRYLSILEKDIITVEIDSITVPAQWLFLENIKDQRGYETVIDLTGYSRGLHHLTVTKNIYRNEEWQAYRVAGSIPFWYYPD